MTSIRRGLITRSKLRRAVKKYEEKGEEGKYLQYLDK